MDADRFDSLSRSLSAAGTRRRALRGLLLGALGAFGSAQTGDIVAHDLAGKCKKKSGKTRKQCLRKARKHRAEHAEEGQSGVCTPACPVCQSCDRGACVPNRSVDDAACNGDGRCLNGVCNPKPGCLPVDGNCAGLGNAACCTKACEGGECDGGADSQPNGAECQVHADCQSERCLGYRCVPGVRTLGGGCFRDPQCASNQCGCAGAGGTQCTCRNATCGGTGALCDPNDPRGLHVDCCEGGCTGVNVGTGQAFCQSA
jgi:hypothetical protein